MQLRKRITAADSLPQLIDNSQPIKTHPLY